MFQLPLTSPDSGDRYTITYTDDGVAVACTCKSFEFSREHPKTCKHIKAANLWHTVCSPTPIPPQDTPTDGNSAEPTMLRRDTGPRLYRSDRGTTDGRLQRRVRSG